MTRGEVKEWKAQRKPLMSRRALSDLAGWLDQKVGQPRSAVQDRERIPVHRRIVRIDNAGAALLQRLARGAVCRHHLAEAEHARTLAGEAGIAGLPLSQRSVSTSFSFLSAASRDFSGFDQSKSVSGLPPIASSQSIPDRPNCTQLRAALRSGWLRQWPVRKP